MFDFNAKRQKTIASLFCLSFSLVLMVSCVAPVVTLARITQQIDAVVSLIDITQKISIAVSNSVNTSYQDLGEQIRNKNFSSEVIEAMEVRYSDLSTKHKELTDSLKKTSTEANQLFSMLQTNADENSTPELKREMLNDISVNKKAFEERIEVAEGVSSKIRISIKKYKDILGFLQNKVALEDVDAYIKIVDETIAKAELLNQDVQTALVEGRQIIKKYEKTSSQQPDKEFPTPMPSPTTTEKQTADGKVDRPYLGVEMINMTLELRKQINENPKAGIEIDVDQGVLVNKVVENSPAAAGGIKPGDVIIEIDGKAVTDVSEVIAEVEKSQVGGELTLQVRRDQQNLTVLARLSVNPNTSNLKGDDNK